MYNAVAEAQRMLRNIVQVSTCYGFRGDAQTLKLAMLTAYFDESGTGSAEKLCIVAGFVGNEAQWTSFVADWILALGERKNLHLTKLRWKKRYGKIVSDLARFGAIPHHYNLSPVSVGMRHRDFIDLWKGKVRERFANPYMTCAQMCIGTVLHEIAGPDDEVQFIFDRQEGRRAQAMDRLHDVVFKIARLDPRVKGIEFRPLWTTVCLDPSDYLAFAVREGEIDKTSAKARASAPILSRPVHGGILTREQITDIGNHYIAHGMTPGSRSLKMSDQLVAALFKAGWNESGVKGFAAAMATGIPVTAKGISDKSV